MNRQNLIDELQTLLEGHDNLSQFTMTFALSLFMNLCLRSLGKRSCVAHPDTTLSMLVNVMEYNLAEVYSDHFIYEINNIDSNVY